MRLIVDEEVLADIERRGAWIAKDNPTAARETVAKILEAVERLELLPMGHPGRVPGTFERGISGTRYAIVYELQERPTALIVTGVFHTAQNQ
jgi:toxin ParE1/3/4